MLKVVIADDEKKVCMLIQKLINWNDLGFEIVGIAYTGKDAYDLINEYMPDVVITDIRMPGFDGIELIKFVKQKGYPVNFIIISGFKHFDYAHAALKFGVEHYLLKPINKNELLDALNKIKMQHEEVNMHLKEVEQIKEELKVNREKIRRNFIKDIISNNCIKDLEIGNINNEYHLSFRNGIFQAIFIKLDIKSSILDINLGSVLEKLLEETERQLKTSSYEFIAYIVNSGIIGVINYGNDKIQDIVKLLEKILERLRIFIDRYDCFYLTVGVGLAKTSIGDIFESIQTSADAIRCRIDLGLDRIINYSDLDYQSIDIANILSFEKERQLVNTIESLDKEAFEKWINSIFEKIHQIKNYNPNVIFDICNRILDIIIQTIKIMGVSEEQILLMQNDIIHMLDTQITEKSIIYHFKNYVLNQIDSLYNEKQSQARRPIRMAKQYILEHFMEPISLENVAENIHLNPSYLSTMFKKETGINFNDYLIYCRIEEAKKLLKNTDLSIEIISEKVGYLDTKYFSKLFNKIVGLKPSTYRKLYS